jgi:hypothetical protein
MHGNKPATLLRAEIAPEMSETDALISEPRIYCVVHR